MFRILFLFALLFTEFASANVFYIQDVDVTFSRYRSQTVRTYAIDAASKKGFERMLHNIVPQDYDLDPLLKDFDVKKASIVEKFTIKNESDEKGRYKATFDILYNKNKVKQVLQKYRLPYTQNDMGNVLLLAIEQKNERELVLFGELNTFASNLVKGFDNNLLINPILPHGSLEEIASYSPSNILDAENNDMVLNLATNYQTNKAIVIFLQKNSQINDNFYNVSARFVGFENMPEQKFVVFGADLEQVSLQISENITNIWRTKNLIEFNKPKRFVASVILTGKIQDYEDIITKLKSLNTVSSVTLKSINTNQALIQTDFYGTPQEFLQSTKVKGLKIYQNNNKQWVIEGIN